MAAAAHPLAAQTLATVRIGMAPTEGITPILWGIKTGAFRDDGLDVQFVVGNNGAAQTAALLGGSLDVAAAAMMPLMQAHVHGVPLRIIAGSTLFNPNAPAAGAVVLKSSRFHSYADLAGTTVMTSTLRSLSEVGMRAMVDKMAGAGTSSSLKFIESPYSAMPAALEKGTAEVGVISEPALTVAMDGGNLRTLGEPNAGISPKEFMIAAFCSAAPYVERNREVIGRFTRTLYRVTAYTNTHHDDTVSMLADYTHIAPDLIRRMTRQTLATSLDVALIQPPIDVAAKYGYLDRAFDAKELVA